MSDDTRIFESHRPDLLALAYRMFGELGRAEDVVQEAVRWQRRTSEVESPKAFLVKVVARLCLNELASARMRREESRPDRLPEPIPLDSIGIGCVEILDQISMASLVVLHRLSPAERRLVLLSGLGDAACAAAQEGHLETVRAHPLHRMLLGRRDPTPSMRSPSSILRGDLLEAAPHPEAARARALTIRDGDTNQRWFQPTALCRSHRGSLKQPPFPCKFHERHRDLGSMFVV
jgi:DNA-directed RNA polymerase specialized sigma24 family protein